MRALRGRHVGLAGQVWAVVKADGYGHGAVAGGARRARRRRRPGCAWRCAGGRAAARGRHRSRRSWCSASSRRRSCRDAVRHGLRLTVYRPEQLDGARGARRGSDVPLHLKVDTGMHRVGAAAAGRGRASPTRSLPRRPPRSKVCSPTWPWPTSPTTRTPPSSSTGSTPCCDRVERRRSPTARSCTPPTRPARSRIRVPATRSSAPASPSTALARAGVDATARRRPAPGAVAARPGVVRQAGAPPATRISYGLRHTFDRDTTVATVPIGYADGVPRRLPAAGGEVLIGGVRRPIVGVVTMDQLMVDCGDDPVAVGDEVVLIGAAGRRSGSPPTEWADRGSARSATRSCAGSRPAWSAGVRAAL